MSKQDETCGVIIDGGPGGLAAAWAASASQSGTAGMTPSGGGGGDGNGVEGGVVLILCIPTGAAGGSRRRAVTKLASLCEAAKVIDLRLPDSCPNFCVNEPARDPAACRLLSHLLADACAEAMALDITRLVWPIHSGAAHETDLRPETIADACDRSLLVSQLASLDAPRTGPGSRGVRIQTPYADLTDRQLAEIVIDLGAPLAACWWCETDAERACASCPSCLRWSNALKRAGARVPLAR